MIRNLLLPPLAALCFGGCAVTDVQQRPAGNFAEASAAFNARLVDDSVKQLESLYPPAQTRFSLRQATGDPYGAGLVTALREKGYAVREIEPNPKTAPATNSSTGTPPVVEPTPGLELGYVLDRLGGGTLYRLVLSVGEKSLARAYVANGEAVSPAGAWVRKE